VVSTTRFCNWVSAAKRTEGISALFLTVLAVVLGLSPTARAQTYNIDVLYDFTASSTSSGGQPQGTLLLHGSTLYGTTTTDGANGAGTIFSLTATGKKAGTYTVLYNFPVGMTSNASVVRDAAGNLYGITNGDTTNTSTAFQLTPEGVFNVLHYFNGGTDGWFPAAALLLGPKGVLYGTTRYGGSGGWGTIFELIPNGDGTWTENVLHSFSGSDGEEPQGALIRDAKGNLYGTTYFGGAYGPGSVFQLVTKGKKAGTLNTLYSFTGGNDGFGPYTTNGLFLDKSGNLYGTTFGGGANSAGVVFELTPAAEGPWTENILYTFGSQYNDADGQGPVGSLIQDKEGNFYSTTSYGGNQINNNGQGVVFQLTPAGGGTYSESVIYSFTGGDDGGHPLGGVVRDAKGDFYVATATGGGGNGQGAADKLIP
jgi:uncharacterized repeat protein (TIGR03803 family)